MNSLPKVASILLLSALPTLASAASFEEESAKAYRCFAFNNGRSGDEATVDLRKGVATYAAAGERSATRLKYAGTAADAARPTLLFKGENENGYLWLEFDTDWEVASVYFNREETENYRKKTRKFNPYVGSSICGN